MTFCSSHPGGGDIEQEEQTSQEDTGMQLFQFWSPVKGRRLTLSEGEDPFSASVTAECTVNFEMPAEPE